MYSAGLYHCYCITNVQCKTVPLLLHHKCTMQDCTTVTASQMYSAGLYHCYCITNVQCRAVPLLLHHKCTMQDCTTVTASQMYSAELHNCYCITNVPSRLQLPLDSWIIETWTKLLCSKFRSMYIYLHNEPWLQIFVIIPVRFWSNFPNSYITYQPFNVRGWGGSRGSFTLWEIINRFGYNSESRLRQTAIAPWLSNRFFAEKTCLPRWNK